MATHFLVFVCGVAVGVAFTMVMGRTKVNASDTDSKVNQQTKKIMNVYVFPTGKCYHSSKCISSQREKNDRLITRANGNETLTSTRKQERRMCMHWVRQVFQIFGLS